MVQVHPKKGQCPELQQLLMTISISIFQILIWLNIKQEKLLQYQTYCKVMKSQLQDNQLKL